MIERDYQRDCRRAISREFKEADSTLIVVPTGCGKTIIFSKVIRDFFPRKALVVAHRQELIYQARDKIQLAAGLKVGIEMGEQFIKTQDGLQADMFGHTAPHVVVATVQTLTAGWVGDQAGGRLSKFNPDDFGLLVCDEAHHFVSPSFRRVIEHFRQNRKLKVLGVTATPDRADEEALGQVFETVAFDYEIEHAIRDGWLVPIEQQMVTVNKLDFSTVRTSGGDFNQSDLGKIFEAEEMLHRITSPSIEIIGSRQALVFTASVLQAEKMCDIFNRHKLGCARWVCGETDKIEREKINKDFNERKFQILCNCGTHTEGFDSPSVEVIIMAKPTKSRSLYAQMVGRSTRPLPGIVDGPDTPTARREAIAASRKPSCLVVDFVGNCGKHRLVSSFDILGGNVSAEAIAQAIQGAIKSGKPVKTKEQLDEEAAREKARIEAEARKAGIVAKAEWHKKKVDPFYILDIEPEKVKGWDKDKKLSERQYNVLRRAGIDPTQLSYTHAKQLIGEILNRWDLHLCTVSQAKVLKKFGYDTNITFEHASKTIDAIAKNGWKRPKHDIAPPASSKPPPRKEVSESVEDVPF